MKARCRGLLSVAAILAAVVCEAFAAGAQNATTSETRPSFAGTWDGKRAEGTAGLELDIHEDGGKVGGSVLLYSEVGGALPLLTPRVEGKSLTFEIERHKCTLCEALGPNAKFLVELTGANEASLWPVDDKGNHAGPEAKLTRRVDSSAWRDPSPHHVQFVIVEYGVRVEVLDWGGTGRPLVLLTGSGNTAHIFDDFAPKLTPFFHVYAITRRGYGESSQPDTGYTEERLAQDVLQVLDALKIVSPVLVGHSAAGGELTRLGDEHSDRLAGLVYLEALADPADFPAANPEYLALYRNLPGPIRDPTLPSASDLKSFETYGQWQERTSGFANPEAESRNMYATNADGSVGAYKASTPYIQEAFGMGALKRDYSRIPVPILAINAAVGEKPKYEPKNDQERGAIDAFNAATVAYVARWKMNVQKAPGGVRFVDLPHANHYIFLSNEADVVRELRDFSAKLK